MSEKPGQPKKQPPSVPPLIPGVGGDERRKHIPPMAPPPPKFVPLRPRFESKPVLSANPKKVRGGVKIPDGDVASPQAWVAQRWLRLLEQACSGPSLVAGLEYAREGQTKRWGVGGGKVDAQIQGRSYKPYVTTLVFAPIPPEGWDKVVQAMGENVMYSAKLLAGEMPPSIEDVFSPLGYKLFPTTPADVRVSCTCGHPMRSRASGEAGVARDAVGDEGEGWCKHVACLAALLAHRLGTEPFLVFALRGLESHDLVERLRQRRAVVGAALGATPIYQQRVAGVSDVKSPPLEESIASFWELGSIDVDISLAPPAVSQPLLRRLGSSPWVQSAQAATAAMGSPPLFPLVGLLASCYETISAEALREASEPVEPESSDADASDASAETGDA